MANHVDREPQLTLRAAIMGMLLGMLTSISNLYLGLKIGTSIAATVTACVLAYAFFSMLHRILPRQFPRFGILENNAMQSSASAASLMATSGLTSAIPALMLIDARALPSHFQLSVWLISVSLLGVFLAIPAKRQMIDVEQLPFPDGIASAALLRSLHGDERTAARQTRALGLSTAFAAALSWFRDAAWPGMPYSNIPLYWGTSWLTIGGYAAPQLTIMLEGSVLIAAFGALIGFNQAWSMLLGAAINYGILAPMMLGRHVIVAPANAPFLYTPILLWSLWTGVPMLVASSLVALALNWRTTVRAFSGMAASFGGDMTRSRRNDVPASWFAIGFAVTGIVTIWLGQVMFHIAWWMGVIAVLSCFVLVIVTARATGETNQTPQGALSKITQFTFGAIAPSSMAINLMTANITAGATAHAADLLGDLKSGYLLDADARQQLVAQVLGVVAGGLVVVPAFFLLVPDPSMLGTARWPAPSAIAWRGVAEVVVHGFSGLDETARIGFAVGTVVGIILTLLHAKLPRLRPYIPSAIGVGLAFIIPAFACISIFVGALVTKWFAKLRPRLAEEFTVPVASGLIVGESLMGVVVPLLTIKGWLQ